MTVRELIKDLMDCNMDADVSIEGSVEYDVEGGEEPGRKEVGFDADVTHIEKNTLRFVVLGSK